MFTSEEGDEAMSPSFVHENIAIQASSWPLEALIATRYMQSGCEWEYFTHSKKNLFADLQAFTSGEDDEAMSPSFEAENKGIGASSSSRKTLSAT